MKCEVCNGHGKLVDAYFCHECGNLEDTIYRIGEDASCISCNSPKVSVRIWKCVFCKETGEREWIDDILRPIESKLIQKDNRHV